jgi:murein DD-endopeptidase MepM/ murein hydrolase activator NlpD
MDLEKITESTMVWTSDLDIEQPLHVSKIKNFAYWINWNGFTFEHQAYDFAAYYLDNGKYVLGLPKNLPVYAIADGRIHYINQGMDPYHQGIVIEHTVKKGNFPHGLRSLYYHVRPRVSEGKDVIKGQKIGVLHSDTFLESAFADKRLLHLHFALYNNERSSSNLATMEVDPAKIYSGLNSFKAVPQERDDFCITEFSV